MMLRLIGSLDQFLIEINGNYYYASHYIYISRYMNEGCTFPSYSLSRNIFCVVFT